MSETKWIRIRDAVKKYAVHARTINRIIDSQQIPQRIKGGAGNDGREKWIDEVAFAQYLESCQISAEEAAEYLTMAQFCEVVNRDKTSAYAILSAGKVAYKKVMCPKTHRRIALIHHKEAERYVAERDAKYSPEEQERALVNGRKAAKKWQLKADEKEDDGSDDPVPPHVLEARSHAVRLMRTPRMADRSPNPHYCPTGKVSSRRVAVDELTQRILGGEVPIDVERLGPADPSPVDNAAKARPMPTHLIRLMAAG